MGLKEILALCLLAISISCNEGCFGRSSVIMGSSTRERIERRDSLTVQGSLEVKEINAKDLTIQGSGEIGPGDSLVDGKLLVQGSLEARGLTVTGSTTVQGSVELDNCTLKESLHIAGEGTLKDTKVHGDIIVKAKKLFLRSGVTVDQRIVFSGEPGEVIIEGTDIHLLGGIVNGVAKKSSEGPASEPLHF